MWSRCTYMYHGARAVTRNCIKDMGAQYTHANFLLLACLVRTRATVWAVLHTWALLHTQGCIGQMGLYSTHGLYCTRGAVFDTWGCIAQMGLYCTHGAVLHIWGCIAHMGPYCIHRTVLNNWHVLHTWDCIAHMGLYWTHFYGTHCFSLIWLYLALWARMRPMGTVLDTCCCIEQICLYWTHGSVLDTCRIGHMGRNTHTVIYCIVITLMTNAMNAYRSV